MKSSRDKLEPTAREKFTAVASRAAARTIVDRPTGPIVLDDGKRCAYAAIDHPLAADVNSAGAFGVGICIEGESGYHPVPDYGPYKTFDDADALAKRLNARLGLDDKTAAIIVVSTMGGGNRRRGRR